MGGERRKEQVEEKETTTRGAWREPLSRKKPRNWRRETGE